MHLKRYSMPKYWHMSKKERKFVIAPRPGPHKKLECIPLLVVLRDVLKVCRNAKEASMVIKKGEILVDKKVRKDPNYPVGLMDIVEIPSIDKHYRVMVNKSGLFLNDIKAEEADKKLCRIQDKKIVKGGNFQLNLHDGRNILTDKNEFRTNDSLLIELPSQKILQHFKFEKNSSAMIMSGKNIGLHGKVKEIFDRKTMIGRNRIVLETKDGDIETVKEYLLVGELK
ncbi:MAG: 30S ribosomal protein S4e [Candidatus Aenigmarchaeota archaeon]|nr:30S ribosomal protein S4e [Candidatus Aenigmarchaeota archaeon]